MGIRGLQTFVQDFVNPKDYCAYKVNIQKLVEEYRKQANGSQPVIVFDGSGIVKYLYSDLDWVSGGQFTEFLQKARKFIDAFKQIGVTPVVFFGGFIESNKLKEWTNRKYNKLNRIFEMFDRLECKEHPSTFHKYNIYRNPISLGHAGYFQYMFGCEVHIGVSECDAEIAHYAKTNNCLAIFAQDSDYLIYEGAKFYLSAEHFDAKKMETINYDRHKLAKYLGLELTQLSLLATLAGTDFVDSADLREFHDSICRSRWKPGAFKNEILFPSLAEYVRTLPLGDALYEVLPEVANVVLKDSKAAPRLEESIRNFIDVPYYPLSEAAADHSDWKEIISQAERLHRTNQAVPRIFKLLLGESYRCSPASEDFRKSDLIAATKLLRPLRQKFYGILFKEKPVEVEPIGLLLERCIEGCEYEDMEKPYYVKPIPPAVHHPGLLTLWGTDRSHEVQNIRWQLFTNSVSPQLDQSWLRNLPNHLLLPVTALHYLTERGSSTNEKGGLSFWEIEALLATSVDLPSMTANELSKLPSDEPDPRAIQLATVFLRSLTTINELLSVCGYPFPRRLVYSYIYFDGKLFQKLYKKAKEMEDEEEKWEFENQEQEEIFKKVQQILAQIYASLGKKTEILS